MVNYYANSTEVLGDNYSIISLECDEYNPNIDGTVTLTVTAKSVYGNPIEDMEIPVTASAGNFTELNGSTITGASSYTGTTNSSGQFTLTYTCSEWGIINFSAKNHKAQISVTGWKQVQTYLTGRLTLYTDGRNGLLKINGSFYPTSTSHLLETISECKPFYTKIVMAGDGYKSQGEYQDTITFRHTGEVYLVSNGGGTHNIYTSIFYPLANPLY